MITDRLLEESDLPVLKASLAKDEHHSETPVDFFQQRGTVAKVYEDEKGPIVYLRATKSMRIDLQFSDNDDRSRNGEALFQAALSLTEAAKANGFTEIVCTTTAPDLANFAVRVLDFEHVSDNYVVRRLL